ncbi:MAG: HD domain-containing protein [Oscillospiraceae bacterium]|nr:HD domain-containing protein [Oscillospiraceae bacterium]
MENRVEILRRHIDEIVLAQTKRHGELWFVEHHLHSVSNFAAMLAIKRKLNHEIAIMIGLLHDIHSLLTDDSKDHALHGSARAREILRPLNIVTDEELEMICTAVKHHSTKNAVHDVYSELVKDADVLSHYFFNPSLPIIKHEQARLENLLCELGLGLGFAKSVKI